MPNIHNSENVKKSVVALATEFLEIFTVLECTSEDGLFLHCDAASKSFYFTCHLKGGEITASADLAATLEADGDTLYKLNRDVLKDQTAYKEMEKDALNGRSFEDIVLEYDPTYNEDQPLKVYGGQHRVEAIRYAIGEDVDKYHGVRVYFDLTQIQKVEIAKINNTSITVANDLLDRMSEQMIGPELRSFCQEIGLLEEGQDFKDKRDPIYPTVKIARTLVYNFQMGRIGSKSGTNDFKVLKSGASKDEDFEKLRAEINWKDTNLLKMGVAFTALHQAQRDKVSKSKGKHPAEFAQKALHISIVSGWAFAAGLFQNDDNALKIIYSLPEHCGNDDPLNAKALSNSKLKGSDPENYRGLGTRINPTEIGRITELFLTLVKKGRVKITKEIANAAIQAFHAKKAKESADKAMEKV